MVVGLNSTILTQFLNITPVYSKDILEIWENRDGGLTLKQMRDMMGTYHQMFPADKYLQQSLITRLVWLND